MLVRGFVQGVGFRAWIARAARSHNVGGWVLNRPDGTVEAVFEGRDDLVRTMVRRCREGPRGAAVEGVEIFEEPPEGLLSFRIR